MAHAKSIAKSEVINNLAMMLKFSRHNLFGDATPCQIIVGKLHGNKTNFGFLFSSAFRCMQRGLWNA